MSAALTLSRFVPAQTHLPKNLRQRLTGALTAAATVALGGAVALGPASPAAASTTRATASAGSVAVGSAQYARPSGAKYVSSSSGSDSGSGSASSPWRTVAKAISAAGSGSTIVLRGGTYHESVTVPSTKKLSIQAYPGEAVWFDGSVALSGWVADGNAWRVPWSYRFDNSPSYTSGGAVSSDSYFQFVSSSYPMAAHPEEVFLDGQPLRQVASRSAVTAGSFFADTGNHRMFVGSNPGGHAVRSASLTTAVSLSGAGSMLRGVGVRRYATSLPLMGTVRVLASGVTVENVVVSDNATQGLFVNRGSAVLRHVTSDRNGSMGIAGSTADGLKLLGVRVTRNNSEHFKHAPAGAGIKITRSRGLTVTNSVSSNNDGTGLWFDESCYNIVATGNDLVGNGLHGTSMEISSKAVYANNKVARNAGIGFKVNNATGVSIWNNTFIDNKIKPMWLVQDDRKASNLSLPGHDPRQSLPDPTVTWILGSLVVKNNVIVRTGGKCLMCLEDFGLNRTASQIGIKTDGNVYNRPSYSAPTSLAVWPRTTYSTLSKFRSATGYEAHSLEITGPSAVTSTDAPTSTVLNVVATVAQPLDSTIATLTGRTSGERHLGAWL